MNELGWSVAGQRVHLNLAVYKVAIEKAIQNVEERTVDGLLSYGRELYKGMSDAEKAMLGSKSKFLHLVRVLCRADKALETVGLDLKTDIELDVPVVPFKSVLKFHGDTAWRKVSAGEEFRVNYMEAFHLLMKPEFSGFFSYNGDNLGARCNPSLFVWLRGDASYPKPVFQLREASIRDVSVYVNTKENGVWVVKPEFVTDFGSLHVRALEDRPKRLSVKEAAAALKKMLRLD